jgi:hypothetical protein
LKGETLLLESNFELPHLRQFYQQLWHPWLPRKVSWMKWLILAQGISVGAWRRVMGLESGCSLCNTDILETIHHAFWACPHTQLAWVKYNNLWMQHNLPTLTN